MATLKIFNDIVSEEEKNFLQYMGMDGVCYKDVHEFLSSIPKDDNDITVRIHCRGGDCVEGWAIYDALRGSGKNISTTVEGECSSMATIILLAAPLERRTAKENTHFCIHNPAVCWLATDFPLRLTADAIDKMTSQAKVQSESLREEQNKILDLYVERTGSDRDELQTLMNKDTYILADKAIELGFISATLAPNTAKRNNQFNNSRKEMSKKTVQVEESKLSRLLAKLGLKSIEDVRPNDIVLTAADGTELTIEREDGDPQVGDLATPDGEFVMEDGTTIIVADGVITDIIAPAEEETTTGAETHSETEALDEDELTAKVEELSAKVADLEKKVADLESENTDLKAQVDEKKDARVLSTDEKVILAKVKRAGGRQWLDKMVGTSSTYVPSGNSFREKGGSAPEGETKTQKAIREQKERFEARRQKK